MGVAQHTPGPWTSIQGTPTRESGGYWSVSVFSLSKAKIRPARAQGEKPEEALANARLIAAAPELLSSMRGLLDSLLAWQEQYDPDHSDGVTATQIGTARDLLARIEGH